MFCMGNTCTILIFKLCEYSHYTATRIQNGGWFWIGTRPSKLRSSTHAPHPEHPTSPERQLGEPPRIEPTTFRTTDHDEDHFAMATTLTIGK